MFFSLHSTDPEQVFSREHFYDNNIVINGPIRMTFETMHPDDPKQTILYTIRNLLKVNKDEQDKPTEKTV